MIKFLGQEKKIQTSEEELNKQLNIQYAHIFKLIEDVREINHKIDRLQQLLEEMSRTKSEIPQIVHKESPTLTKRDKTRDAIKLILKRRGKMTSEDLCKIIGLSRTRCNEYLKDLERDKEAKSEIIDRKKYYRII